MSTSSSYQWPATYQAMPRNHTRCTARPRVWWIYTCFVYRNWIMMPFSHFLAVSTLIEEWPHVHACSRWSLIIISVWWSASIMRQKSYLRSPQSALWKWESQRHRQFLFKTSCFVSGIKGTMIWTRSSVVLLISKASKPRYALTQRWMVDADLYF